VRGCIVTLFVIVGTLAACGEPAVNDRPANVDEKLWKLLTEIDARGAAV
jgi:hypothetical protein